ncbi:DNA-binding LytR/AlgR family response regulator [Brevundimonas alba]|uniref:DNA-binding LytR/AlgR family response regulator n=1 Tax=Brevundimonas alba TaxID=74314 RepID=A0A7X6BP82_9CAUL|nr:LytTR family DNA-binding domain-containing protein [Brevundimonas alba]NJC41704.1 DNA-binding LytR/AlgR family response regulator [Brevundimonas alba]
MRVIVADDEPLAVGKMQSSLACIPSVEVVGCARNGVEALSMIRSLKPDLVILDIEMPGRNGLSVIENLRSGEAIPEVIFSTAFAHYAVKAFEVNAVDYLTKPIAFDRLRDAVRNAEERLAARTANQRFSELQALIASLQAEAGNDGQAYEQELWIRRKEGLERLPVSSIDLIEAQGDYVNLHIGDEMHLIRDTVSSLCHRLNPVVFVRSHRSFLVNITRVRGIRRKAGGRMELTLDTGRLVAVGPSYAESTLKAVNAKRWR